jgi:hypothetical protein
MDYKFLTNKRSEFYCSARRTTQTISMSGRAHCEFILIYDQYSLHYLKMLDNYICEFQTCKLHVRPCRKLKSECFLSRLHKSFASPFKFWSLGDVRQLTTSSFLIGVFKQSGTSVPKYSNPIRQFTPYSIVSGQPNSDIWVPYAGLSSVVNKPRC